MNSKNVRIIKKKKPGGADVKVIVDWIVIMWTSSKSRTDYVIFSISVLLRTGELP